ncbi:MAG: hypothetical protein ACTHM9_06515 [Gemmatimonadales bacterium]
MRMATDAEQGWEVPELGPGLGRLVDAAPAERGALQIPLDDLRQDLVTGIFELAGAARGFAAAGDRDGMVVALNRVAWLGLWEKAVASVATRIATEVNAGLESAAAESRFPARRLPGLILADADVRAIAARLGSGGAPLVAALDALEQAAKTSSSAAAWRASVAAVARRVESAWLTMEDTSRREQANWAGEIARVRRWRRPAWPLWIVTGVVAAAAIYLGLVLGGYLPVPRALQGLARLWWSWP